MLLLKEEAHTSQRSDLRRLSLQAAIELDKLARGQGGNRKILDQFLSSLQGEPEPGAPGGVRFLANHRTLNASNRAWQRTASKSVATVEELAAEVLGRLRSLLDGLEPHPTAPASGYDATVAEEMKRFCLSLHQELLQQYTDRHRTRHARRDDGKG